MKGIPILLQNLLLIVGAVSSFQPMTTQKFRKVSFLNQSESQPVDSTVLADSFDTIVQSRYACTRFHRHEDSSNVSVKSSQSNADIVKKAFHCLDLSRRAPSGFNAQPYRMILVHTTSQKELLANYCLGRNADRVRDSDCTAVFLADKECLRDYKRFGSFLQKTARGRTTNKSKPLSPWARRKIQGLVLLFSSGWPLPRFVANPLSFCIRLGVSACSAITRRKLLVPSLASAETWATKNTMLVAMTYMLACSSRGIETCPMEGFNAGGIRKVLGIPRQYSIPLIVSTGLPYRREAEEEGEDDVGMGHGSALLKSDNESSRFPY